MSSSGIVTRSKSKSKSDKCAAPISAMQNAQTTGPLKSDRMSTEESSIASTHKSSISSELKTTSTKSKGSRSSKRSLKSAKVKMAVTLSRLKSQADIHALEMQQCQKRAKYEQEQLAQSCRREEQERQKRAKYEQEQLVQTCSREEQERRFQHQLAELKLNAELNEAIAEASVYEEEAQLEVPSPLPTNPKTVSTLLQYPEPSNVLEHVCAITHSDTNALSNPVAVTHNIDVANQNITVYSKNNVLDWTPFQYGNASRAPDTGVPIMSSIETPRCGSGFSNFSQPFYAEVSNLHPAGQTSKLTKNASNSATVSFSNIPATENDKASRKPFQGPTSNSKEKVKGLSPEFVEIGKPCARAHEPIIIQAPAPSLEPPVFDGLILPRQLKS